MMVTWKRRITVYSTDSQILPRSANYNYCFIHTSKRARNTHQSHERKRNRPAPRRTTHVNVPAQASVYTARQTILEPNSWLLTLCFLSLYFYYLFQNRNFNPIQSENNARRKKRKCRVCVVYHRNIFYSYLSFRKVGLIRYEDKLCITMLYFK